MTFADQIMEQSVAIVRKANAEVRKHPLATAAIAVAAVGLIGYTIRQARRASHDGPRALTTRHSCP